MAKRKIEVTLADGSKGTRTTDKDYRFAVVVSQVDYTGRTVQSASSWSTRRDLATKMMFDYRQALTPGYRSDEIRATYVAGLADVQIVEVGGKAEDPGLVATVDQIAEVLRARRDYVAAEAGRDARWYQRSSVEVAEYEQVVEAAGEDVKDRWGLTVGRLLTDARVSLKAATRNVTKWDRESVEVEALIAVWSDLKAKGVAGFWRVSASALSGVSKGTVQSFVRVQDPSGKDTRIAVGCGRDAVDAIRQAARFVEAQGVAAEAWS